MDASAVVSLQGPGTLTVADIRSHRLTLDEPEPMGGTDAGPTPLETLLAALGACTAMTLRLYADRKGWDLDTVRVKLTHRETPRAECLDCRPSPFERVDRLHRVVELEGNLNDEQIARLREIADRCPVHRVLTRDAAVVTEIHHLEKEPSSAAA
jgi:putative redox protein